MATEMQSPLPAGVGGEEEEGSEWGGRDLKAGKGPDWPWRSREGWGKSRGWAPGAGKTRAGTPHLSAGTPQPPREIRPPWNRHSHPVLQGVPEAWWPVSAKWPSAQPPGLGQNPRCKFTGPHPQPPVLPSLPVGDSGNRYMSPYPKRDGGIWGHIHLRAKALEKVFSCIYLTFVCAPTHSQNTPVPTADTHTQTRLSATLPGLPGGDPPPPQSGLCQASV